MVYIISGFMRSGTSMMMAALEAGGLEACFSQKQEDRIARQGDEYYDPQKHGLYELDPEEYKNPFFPTKYKNKLIKCLLGGIRNWFPQEEGIKVIVMRRNIEEIRQSHRALYPQSEITLTKIKQALNVNLKLLKNRKDTEYIEVWYRDVIEDCVSGKLTQFERIRNFGFPIDSEKSMSVVDPEFCRYKIEELTIGI